jgi:hypothetical protein
VRRGGRRVVGRVCRGRVGDRHPRARSAVMWPREVACFQIQRYRSGGNRHVFLERDQFPRLWYHGKHINKPIPMKGLDRIRSSAKAIRNIIRGEDQGAAALKEALINELNEEQARGAVLAVRSYFKAQEGRVPDREVTMGDIFALAQTLVAGTENKRRVEQLTNYLNANPEKYKRVLEIVRQWKQHNRRG